MPVIMDADRMSRSLTRIAHEVLERNRGTDGIALVGIRTRGDVLAKRLAKVLEQITNAPIRTGALDITLYRDDLMRHVVGPQPLVRRTEIPFSIDDQKILLVDDVLYTGRTIRAALDALIDFGRPKEIQLDRARGPRASRTADQSRLRREKRSNVAERDRDGPAGRNGRRRRSVGESSVKRTDP